MLVLFIVCVVTVTLYAVLYLREVELNKNEKNKHRAESRKSENE